MVSGPAVLQGVLVSGIFKKSTINILENIKCELLWIRDKSEPYGDTGAVAVHGFSCEEGGSKCLGRGETDSVQWTGEMWEGIITERKYTKILRAGPRGTTYIHTCTAPNMSDIKNLSPSPSLRTQNLVQSLQSKVQS